MHFLNDTSLARRFKADEVPSRERLYYVLVVSLGYILLSSNMFLSLISYDFNMWDYYSDAVSIVINFVGIVWLYRTNAKGDNKEFIERFVCMGLPVAVQMTLLTAVLGTLLFAVVYDAEDIPLDATVYDVVMLAFAQIYFFARLNRAIRIASH